MFDDPSTPGRMTTRERLKYLAYRSLPDTLIPGDLKGKLVINGFLKDTPRRKEGLKGRFTPTLFQKKILSTPGTNQSIYTYLNSEEGAKRIPEIVERKLGKKWYTGPAKLLSRTPFGRNIVIDKIMDQMLPKINGDTSLARTFLAAGGMV